ncbi:MAG: diguanylate cyclase domain-containing protein [Candidatus Aminicenantia bacterium]
MMKEWEQMDKALRDLIEIIHFTENVSAKIHGVLDEAEIYRTVKEEFAQSRRYTMSILLLTDDGSSLRVVEVSVPPGKLKAGEKVTGLRVGGYKIDVNKSSIYSQVVREGKTLQVNVSDIIGELFPRRLASLISKTMGFEKMPSILTPLKRHGKIIGTLNMSSTDLAEYFIPSVRNLAQHISNALELADENAERKRAEEALKEYSERLKEMVEQRTAELEMANEQLQRDITERKRAEEALRESEEKYRNIVETAPDGIATVNLRGIVTSCNNAFTNISGFSKSEIVGKHFSKLPTLRARDIPKYAKVFNSLIKGKLPKPFEITWLRKDGAAHWAEIHVSLMKKGRKIIGFQVIARDITERKRAEAEIQRNYDTQTVINSFLHLSLENIPLEELLKLALDIILSIPWFAFEARGSVFLVEDDPKVLVMKAQSGLAELHQKTCALIPFGKCLCGRAALMREIQFADRLDDRHKTQYEGITPHGHYCVPILFAGRTLGVINMYLREGHHRDQKEEEFLTAIANTLAGIIVRKRAEEALRESKERYRHFIENASDIIYETDETGRLTFFNPITVKMLGYSEGALIRKHYLDFIRLDYREDAEKFYKLQLVKKIPSTYHELPAITKDGKEIWLGQNVQLVMEGGRVVGFQAVAREITERKRMEETIKQLAYQDALTGLPNRLLFIDRLTIALTHAHRKQRKVAVMLLDLDRFKDINDTLGHSVGDQLLKAVSDRLTRLLRKSDTIARMGGDEFLLLLPEIAQVKEIAELAVKILEAFREPFVFNGHELRITTSIGIAVYPRDGEDADALIKNADIAMYHAKEEGRDNYQLYTSAMNVKALK